MRRRLGLWPLSPSGHTAPAEATAAWCVGNAHVPGAWNCHAVSMAPTTPQVAAGHLPVAETSLCDTTGLLATMPF